MSTPRRPNIVYVFADQMQTNNLIGDPAAAPLLEARVQTWLDRTNDPFETSRQVADRYLPGTVDGCMPYYENETIRRGRAERNAHQ